MDGFGQRATTLDLNGPILSWVTQPTGVTTCGVGTFIGIATATFPVGLPASYGTNTGSMSYSWHYKVGSATTIGSLYDGDIPGLGLTAVSGSGTTTLTVYGTSKGEFQSLDGLKFLLRPDYVPSAYGTGDPITAGTGRSTGNANNELAIDSNVISFTFHPDIKVTTQPTSQIIPTTNAPELAGTATFNVVGIVTGYGPQTLSYQWTADGSDLSNGETQLTKSVAVDPYNQKADGFSGEGIYYLSTGWNPGTFRTVQFSTWEESAIFHYINIEGINNFPENYGSGNFNVSGGKVYKCTAPNGNLYIGGDTPAGGGNQRLIVEEGGDDWNDMVLNVGTGFFARLTEAPVITNGGAFETRTFTDRIEGAQSPTLKISTATAGIQTVNCRITHPTACNSPHYTNTVNLSVISSRQIINWEYLNAGNGDWYDGGEHNIFDSAKRWDAPIAVGPKTLVVYAPEQDIVAKVTLAAPAGRSSDVTVDMTGGEGGVSQFYLTMEKNHEYVVKLGTSNDSPDGGSGGCFLYKGGQLVVAIGGGGGAGTHHQGGNGGGIGVAGANGNGPAGSTAARGGPRFTDGTLPLQGYFQGGSWLPPRRGRDGGRVSACTFGQYWTGRGYSACQSLGTTRFYAANGTRVDNSTNDIIRGYKAGLGHRGNNGSSFYSTGGGGGGAHGGSGSFSAQWGGGGGSGYQNGTVEVISTRRGGNTSYNGYVIFEV